MCTGKVRHVMVLRGPYHYYPYFVSEGVYWLKTQEGLRLVGCGPP
ncbi:MAG: hypothetical protein OEY86_09105 [Nitrospira sp.]|nr:hypothetical protein [Nitrospira sp.]